MMASQIRENEPPGISLLNATNALASRENEAERTGILIGGAIVVIVAAIIGGAFWFVNRPAAIPSLTLDTTTITTIGRTSKSLDSLVTSSYLKAHRLITGTAERRDGK